MIDEMFTGPSRRLKSMLEADVPSALTELARRIASLESYAGLRPDHAPLSASTGVPASGASQLNPTEAKANENPDSPPSSEGGV
jgi:hypothetical protein